MPRIRMNKANKFDAETILREKVESEGAQLVLYGLTEYEASILQGALVTFRDEHAGGDYDVDAGTAQILLERAEDQLPPAWKVDAK